MNKVDVDGEMTAFFVSYYYQKGYLQESEVAKICMLRFYRRLIGLGEIEPIENLPQEHKDRLWQETGGSRVKCRILHLINTINGKETQNRITNY